MLERGPVRRPHNPARRSLILAIAALAALALAGCGSASANRVDSEATSTTVAKALPLPNQINGASSTAGGPPDRTTNPGGSTDPPATGPTSIYGYTAVGDMSAAVADAKNYVYVPSNDSGNVTVIDQKTLAIVGTFPVGKLVQHVVASWDLKTLYATASGANQLVPIDPSTGKPGLPIRIAAPYNLYFTPDGSHAIVMAERLNRMDFYDPHTWQLSFSVPTGACDGVNHADWSPDGSWFLATCEFSGDVIKVDTATGQIINRLSLASGAMPQDLRLAPDGTKFYVADMMHAGVWVVNADGTAVTGFIATGVGAHGIYPSRDATRIFVSNRGRTAHDVGRTSRPGEGSISVVDPATDKVLETWIIPGGGSPDMGGVSADGNTLWLSGRYDAVVYVFDTRTGELRAKIPVAPGPHGLNVFPQPGRYSLGHTGNYR
ncbi:MAG: YncE family protein [Ilumatobacteraceae bacterium]